MTEHRTDPSGGTGRTSGQPPGAPRWVKVSGIVVVVLVAMVAVMLLAGGGHGPGRHTGVGG